MRKVEEFKQGTQIKDSQTLILAMKAGIIKKIKEQLNTSTDITIDDIQE